MRIIAVDDKEEERYLLETLLKGSGYQVETATNGAEALEKLHTEGFDMIVSDVLMPVMDGFKFCRECKRDEKLKHIPFVFYTATYKDERDEELASKLGAEKYIRKPIEPDEFIKVIQDVIRDMEEGRVGPKKPVVEAEEEVFKLYSERLVEKLEKKMLELEREITERKKAQAGLEHLNMVLRAVRKVNQLITKEDNRDQLLQGACDNLVKTRGYYHAWIALMDESAGLVTTAEAGLGEDFTPMVEWLERGELTECARRALKQSGIVTIEDTSPACADCPLVKRDGGNGTLTVRLEYSGKFYGLLSVSMPVHFAADKEEQNLFQEVAEDIAFALYRMELEEERKRLEHGLNERVKELQCLYRIADIAERPGITLDEICQQAANLLPTSWQYPEIACARIIIGDKEFKTENYAEPQWKQSSDIKIDETKAGSVEVGYLEERPEIGEGPFLKEERLLIDAIAERLGRFQEHKRAEEKAREVEILRELDQLRSGLLANVSHELRTPLTSIKGFASTLLRSDVKWSEEEQQDFLQSIDHETERLIRLISDLLDMSRIEAGELKLEKNHYQISEILDSVSARLASLTEHHQLEVIVPSELPPVFVDRMRIGQVLTNLVENAAKYSGEGSQITVEAQLAGDQIIVSVADRGQGIPAELLDKVFDRFYQAESIVTGRKSGTGLGLSICKGIMEAHGGRMWVESKLGEGSKFSFSLPVGKGQGEIA